MDIRSWPIDRIMQLPDFCFGRRFMLSCTISTAPGIQTWDISELAFPEKAVIWEFTIELLGLYDIADYYRLAIGDQQPTTAAQMDALDPLFPGMGLQGAEPRHNVSRLYIGSAMRMFKMPIQASGRRMILELTPTAATEKAMSALIIISSIPTEVPEWLISGPGRGL